MMRRCRVTVRGRFTGLTADQRAHLRATQDDHDMFTARFTPEGTFLYAPELVAYQHRFAITVDEATPEDADSMARLRAEELSDDDMGARGLTGTITDVSVVSIDDMKVRKGGAR